MEIFLSENLLLEF